MQLIFLLAFHKQPLSWQFVHCSMFTRCMDTLFVELMLDIQYTAIISDSNHDYQVCCSWRQGPWPSFITTVSTKLDHGWWAEITVWIVLKVYIKAFCAPVHFFCIYAHLFLRNSFMKFCPDYLFPSSLSLVLHRFEWENVTVKQRTICKCLWRL